MAEAAAVDAGAEGQIPAAGEQQGKSPNGDGPHGSEEPNGGKSFPEAYVKQLRSEAAEARRLLAEAQEKLEEHESAGKSELEKLSDRVSAAEQRATAAEERALRYEIAAERGLDLKAAAFLTGATRDEIEARADELGELLQDGGRKPVAGFDGGARMPVPDPVPPEKAHNDFLLRAMGREPTPRRRAS